MISSDGDFRNTVRGRKIKQSNQLSEKALDKSRQRNGHWSEVTPLPLFFFFPSSHHHTTSIMFPSLRAPPQSID